MRIEKVMYSHSELNSKTKDELINIILALEATNQLWRHATKELLKPPPTPYVGYDKGRK